MRKLRLKGKGLAWDEGPQEAEPGFALLPSTLSWTDGVAQGKVCTAPLPPERFLG